MAQNISDLTESSQHQTRAAKPIKLIAILGGAASLCFVVVFVVCCGAGIWMANFGMSVVSADIERQLRDHPQIRQSVGETESLEVNWAHSLAHEDENTFIYDVIGSKGRGQITIESVSNSEGSEEIVSAELRLSTGEIVDLALE